MTPIETGEVIECPVGWVATTLGELLSVIRGVTYEKQYAIEAAQNPPATNEAFVPILRANNIGEALTFDNLVWVPQRFVSPDQYLRLNDIIIAASSGSISVVGKSAQLKNPWHGSFGAFCYGLRPYSRVNSQYVAFFLQTSEYRNRVSSLAAGVNINNLRRNHIEEIPILLAPISEQARIVAEIEQRFSLIDAGIASLKRALANLKRYRASVLQAACTGKLVPTEAELARAEGREFEPADVLLQRILAERRARWEADQLTKMTAQGRVPRDDKWKAKYEEPTPPDTRSLLEMSEGWTWATVQQLSSLVTDGDHNPPKRVPHGVPHLTARNVVGSRLNFTNCTFVSEYDAKKVFLRYKPLAGDLIVTCVGTIGRTAIVQKEHYFTPDRNLAAIRLVGNDMLTRFLEFVLISPSYQRILYSVSGSTAQPHLYLGDLRILTIPVPPNAEQERIIAEVERHLTVADHIESTLVASLKRAQRLKQSILRDAFAGRLVPQDPSDEPASVLLERIRAERATATKGNRAPVSSSSTGAGRGRPRKSEVSIDGRSESDVAAGARVPRVVAARVRDAQKEAQVQPDLFSLDGA